MKTFIVIYLIAIVNLVFAQTANSKLASEYHQTARDHLLSSRYDSAVFYLDSTVALMPYGFEAYFERGYAKMQQEKFAESIVDFSIIISKANYKYEAFFNRGVCYFQLGSLHQAKQDFSKVLTLDPTNKRAQEYLNEIALIEKYNNVNSNQFSSKKRELKDSLYWQRRRNEQLIWGTVIPVLFWTTVFLTW